MGLCCRLVGLCQELRDVHGQAHTVEAGGPELVYALQEMNCFHHPCSSPYPLFATPIGGASSPYVTNRAVACHHFVQQQTMSFHAGTQSPVPILTQTTTPSHLLMLAPRDASSLLTSGFAPSPPTATLTAFP